MSRAHIIVIVGTTLLGVMGATGCRQSPPPPPTAIATEPDPIVAAREAMARDDHVAAAGWLRQIVARHPDHFEAHYRLGVTASHLDRVEEAEAEFEWVVAHGTPGSPEVPIARDWLASRTEPAIVAPVATVAVEERPAQRPELASLQGRASGSDKPLTRLQLILEGLPRGTAKGESHILRTDQEGRFHFPDVAPGEYKLTTALRAPVRWRLRVPLAKGERLVLDLTPDNQLSVRDDFPEGKP